MTVPYTFGTATSSIPLSQLDSNFNTPITLGNTAVYLGNTTTTLNALTLSNVTITSGNVTITGVTVANVNVTSTLTLSGLTASTALALDASKNVVSVTNTGSGNNVLATSPTLTTPNLGTPSALTLTNATGLPLSTGVTGTLSTANGGTGLTSFTANGVVYASSTSALATGSNLVFNGTQLGIGTSSPSNKLTIQADATGTSFADNGIAQLLVEGLTDYTKRIGLGIDTTNNVGVIQVQKYGTGTYPLVLNPAGGNVGIGVSSPSALLDVNGNIYTEGGNTGITLGANQGGGAVLLYNQNGNLDISPRSGYSTVFKLSSGGTEAVRINSSGYLGIGTSSPAAPLVVHVATNANFAVQNTSGNLQLQSINDAANAFKPLDLAGSIITISPNSSEAVRIDNSGNLLVNTTSQYGTAKITASSSATDGISSTQATTGGYCYVANALSNSGTYYFNLYKANGTTTGSITSNGTTTSYNITSDQRLKTNIVDAPDGNIDQIKIRSFDWKSDGTHNTYGVIAQELIEVAPYAVSMPKNPEEMMGVDYSKLVPMLVKEIQSLRKRLAAAGIA